MSAMTQERRLGLTSAGLAALLAALGAYVYLVEVPGGQRRERATAAASRLVSFSPEAVTELVITKPTGRIVCARKSDRWKIVEPVRTDADEGAISSILKDLTEARVEQVVTENAGNLAGFDLKRPVAFTLAAGDIRETVEVGGQNPTGDFVYARRRGGTSETGAVLLVKGQLRGAAEKQLYDLREKSVLDLSSEDVMRVTFVNQGKIVRLAREPAEDADQAGWKLLSPLRARADRSQVQRALNSLSYVRAERFVSERPERLDRFGLARPWGSVRFDLKGGRSETLLFGRKTEEGALPRYFARKPGSGPVFTINDNIPRDTQQLPGEWREKRLTDFARADVAQLRIITPSGTLICAKRESPDGEEWGMAEFSGEVAEGMDLGAAARMPTSQQADRDRVDGLVGHLSTLDAKRFIDGAAPSGARFGLAPPGLKIAVLDRSGKVLASVSIGRRKGDHCYATGPHLGGVVQVLASDADRFRVRLVDLANRS